MVQQRTTTAQQHFTQRTLNTQRTQHATSQRQNLTNRQTPSLQNKVTYRPYVKNTTTMKVGVTMTCGNCHTCKRPLTKPPPTLAQGPVMPRSGIPNLTLRTGSGTLQLAMRPGYRPPAISTSSSRPYPSMQMVTTRGFSQPLLIPVQSPRYQPGFFDLMMRRPSQPTSFDLAMQRLVLTPTEQTQTMSPKSPGPLDSPPALPEMTPFLPTRGSDGIAISLADLPRTLRVPADLIVPGSTALVQAPLLPEMPEHAPDAPALPRLPYETYPRLMMVQGR